MRASSLTEYLTDASTELPEQIAAEEAIAAVVTLHAQNGGVTFSLYFGNLAGQERLRT